ncbi:MAG: hypothetical protein LBP53_01440 [Candidatus Peribacteria bacterium]|nr:hypothetical protein [Candidatus Peribacteria bacterium]
MYSLDQADHITYAIFLKGLTPETVRRISADLQEPDRMLQHRLQCLEIFHKSKSPSF